jgi:Leucine-rich repeat (LRR) protein
LTGTVPSSLALLTNLQGLYLDSNELTGTVLDYTTSMHDLQYLDVQLNDFVGTIPSELGTLTQLQ